MNVYDFDKTILKGDSTKQFYLWCLKRHPRMALRWPGLAVRFVQWKTGRCDKTAFKSLLFRFLRDIGDVDGEVALFWQKKEGRIYRWYLKKKQPEDVIVSASPEFLLRPICQKLDVKLIASRVDPVSGAFDGQNCYGAEKVSRFAAHYPGAQVDEFYSDSRTDEPMAKLARRAYFVREGVPEPW